MTLEVSITNVGGIESLTTSFESGTNLIAAPNASNKTSVLKAIAFALGTDDVPIRSGATSAEVVLTLGDRTVTRTAERRGVGKTFSGTPWLDDEGTRAQFTAVAALLEFNDLRTAVRQRSDIEAALKAPIDFDAIERRRADLLGEKQSLKHEYDSLDGVETKLEQTRADIDDARDRRSELAAKLGQLEDEREPGTSDDEADALRERRTELRNERREVEERIDATEDAIDRFEEKRASLDDDIRAVAARRQDDDVQALYSQRTRLEAELESLREKVDVLQSVLTANREMLASEFTGTLGSSHRLDGDELSCWTCGQATSVEAVEETTSDLQSLVTDGKARIDERRPDIEDIEETLASVQSTESELDQLRTERRRLDERVTDRKSSLETQSERLETITADLDDVDEALEVAERDRADADAELAEAIEATRLEQQTVDRQVTRLESIAEDLRADRERRVRLRETLDEHSQEIQALTDRLETMEHRLRTQFNDAMDEVLTALDFDRVQRVWLDGEFEIVVAREVDGSVTEDSVGNLAESERELIGLVLGLSGYLAYDLVETVPVVLLDSLGALDNERVARLIEYFRDFPDFLIAAVHPDTAERLADSDVRTIRATSL